MEGKFFIVVIVIAAVKSGNEQTKQLMRQEMLTSMPVEDLRLIRQTRTCAKRLSNGRKYSNLTRNKSGVLCLMKLLFQRYKCCVRRSPYTSEQQAGSISDTGITFTKLTGLQTKGLIDEEEYTTRREKNLDKI